MTIAANHRRAAALCLAATAALAAAGLTNAATTGDLVTISLSGSTAMRNFTTSAGISFLQPGGSITLNSGSGGTPVTFTNPNTSTASLQLAPTVYPATDPNEVNGLRLEWHEQGSVEGILELVNDQIGTIPAGILPDRTPSSANPTWVNRVKYTGVTSGNLGIGTFGTASGQSRVQMAISDVNSVQGFSITGATGAYNLTPGNAGYGKGNSLLAAAPNISGLGYVNSRQQLLDSSILNMSSDKTDPGTGAAYASSKPWNNAGQANLDNHVVAVTATLFVASPGTGLTEINRGDAQWLQTTGRLQNGADFYVAQRDENSGTRNVAALNTGVDPSWAVGENDGGNNSSPSQNSIGASLKFSGKTAGSAVRTTVQNSRLAIGPLGMSDAIASVKDNTSNTPLRALKYSDTATDAGANFVQASASSITDGSYVIWQQETYVTVKDNNSAAANTIAGGGNPSGDWAAATDDGRNSTTSVGIKGDNSGTDVADFRQNILGSVKNFPGSLSVANPADQLLATSFILPQMVWKGKLVDGVGLATAKSTDVNTNSSDGGVSYNATLRNDLLLSSYAAKFNTGDPSTITSGSGASYNGASGGSSAGNITITDNGSGHGNWLFGNFNQNGVRDFSAVKAAQAAQAALFASGVGVDANAGSANNSSVAGLSSKLDSSGTGMTGFDGTAGAKKGDLIVMGDYNGDGKFDGQDLYLLAHGAALADNSATDHLTSASGATFGDQVRHGVLLKNAALDWMQSNATAQQKIDASANLTNDPSGANAFNKFDINRDGLVNLADAKLVDHFVGKDYRNLNDQLGAVIQTASGPAPFNLVDAELNDNGTITSVISGTGSDGTGTSDFKLLRDALGSKLLNGDANFDGTVDVTDLGLLATDWQQHVDRWSLGDFNFDGVVDVSDLGLLATNWQQSSGSLAAALAALGLGNVAVPEPASLGLFGLAAGAMLIRRRRR